MSLTYVSDNAVVRYGINSEGFDFVSLCARFVEFQRVFPLDDG